MMRASPGARPVARPVWLTLAIVGSAVDQVKVTPAIGSSAASVALAVNCCVAPWSIVADGGEIVTSSTTAGGVSSWSLHAPNECADDALHVPSPLRFSD